MYDRPMILPLVVLSVFAADSGFACDRAALAPAERKRHFEEVTPALKKQVKGLQELEQGYAFEFPLSALPLAAEWVMREHLCCPFLEITIRIEPEKNGKAWLQITGKPGVKEFVRAEFTLAG